MTRMALNKIHWPVTALGPGERVGIWMQGCSIHCPGCMSLDTWGTPDESWTTVGNVLATIEQPLACADGVTISGGEPFDQPQALLALVTGLKDMTRELDKPLDVLCYSGRPLQFLRDHYGEILGHLDAIISDPFARRLPSRLVWRGSNNQRLTPLSDLGQQRYAPYLHAEVESPQVQIEVDDDSIWMIGIPSRATLEKLESTLTQRGISLGEPSWRS